MRSTHSEFPLPTAIPPISLSFPCPQEVSTFATDDLAVVGGASGAAGINGQQGKAAENNQSRKRNKFINNPKSNILKTCI